MAQLTDNLPTIASKIRALHAQGFRRSEIARFLHRDPTQVRNVIKADAIRRGCPSAAKVGPAASGDNKSPPAHGGDGGWDHINHILNTHFRLEVDAEGRITLPPQALEVLKTHEAPVLSAQIEGDTLVLIGVGEAHRRVQAWVKAAIPPGPSLVDELIADRRREAEAEAADG